MTTLKGNRKEGAMIQCTKSWGYRVIDYKNTIGGRPQSRNCATLEKAEELYTSIINQKDATDSPSLS